MTAGRMHLFKCRERWGARARNGAVYVAVLGVSMIVAVCALAGLHLARAELESARRSSDREEARLLAVGAVELAVAAMNRSPHDQGQWRTHFANDVETTPVEVDGGTMAFKLVDDDGDLADDPTDAVWIHGIGRVGDAVWVERAKARPDPGKPLAALNSAVHCSGEFWVRSGTDLVVSDAPASTDGELDVDGAIWGNAAAVEISGYGWVSGTLDVPTEQRGVPWPSVFHDYAARATHLPHTGDLNEVVLSPKVNEYGGGLNADGLYYIDATQGDIKIKDSRIHGTLLIDAGDKVVRIDQQCFLEPFRSDYPVLIIKARRTELEIESYGSSRYLSESSEGHNFNPPGAPYLGSVDYDRRDEYPSEIRGLIHVIGEVEFEHRGIYRGAILVQGEVDADDGPHYIFHDRSLIMDPPWGYTSDPDSTRMIIQRQTWSRRPSP